MESWGLVPRGWLCQGRPGFHPGMSVASRSCRGPKPSPLEPLEGASPVHTLTSAW